ncbi:MAG: nuclear transport factor 2 family protein [Actinomycetes bacterium]
MPQISTDLFPARQKVIAQLVNAINSKDLTGLSEHFLDGFVSKDSEGTVIIDGFPALIKGLSEIFEKFPDVQIRVDGCIGVGDLLTHSEHIFNFADGHTEDWIYVYKFSGVKIVNWHGYSAKTS